MIKSVRKRSFSSCHSDGKTAGPRERDAQRPKEADVGSNGLVVPRRQVTLGGMMHPRILQTPTISSIRTTLIAADDAWYGVVRVGQDNPVGI